MLRRSLVALGVVAVLVGGCSSASPPSAPAGVDELTIPTPAPDPADFVSGVDNPWLPLAPGATWTYEVEGEPGSPVTVHVRDATETVAGVRTTVVDRTGPEGLERTDHYAQDRAGNVWWFGRDGLFRAGEDGAEAGLLVPATPRLGDGWRPAYAEGRVEETATVTDLDGEATTPAGTFGGLLVIETGGSRALYAEGLGLVEEADATSVLALLTAPGDALGD